MARPEKKSGQKYWSGRGGGKASQSGGKTVQGGGEKPSAGKAWSGNPGPGGTGRQGSPAGKDPGGKTREFPSARTPACKDLLARGLIHFGLDPALSGPIDLYLKEIELWNPRLGLVEAGGADLMVKHILDSLSLCLPLAGLMTRTCTAPVLRIADLGSGGGFPALPLALFLKQSRSGAWSMDLYDKQARRTGFLRNCVVMLGLKGMVEVHQTILAGMDHQIGRGPVSMSPGTKLPDAGSGRAGGMEGPDIPFAGASPGMPVSGEAENLDRAAGYEEDFEGSSRLGQICHVVTARAFRPLDDEILAAMREMLVPGGWICLMKARKDSIKDELTRVRIQMQVVNSVEEIPADPGSGQGKAWVLPVEIPGLGEERHLVFIPG